MSNKLDRFFVGVVGLVSAGILVLLGAPTIIQQAWTYKWYAGIPVAMGFFCLWLIINRIINGSFQVSSAISAVRVYDRLGIPCLFLTAAVASLSYTCFSLESADPLMRAYGIVLGLLMATGLGTFALQAWRAG